MAMKFSNLTNDDIQCVFSHLPICTLLTIESVCKRWQSLSNDLCSRQRSLIIVPSSTQFYTETEVNRFGFHFQAQLFTLNPNRLVVPKLTDYRVFRLLCAKFPRITELVVLSGNLSSVAKQIIWLLTYQWTSLRSFSLLVQDGDPDTPAGIHWNKLLTALGNSSASLRSLTLWSYCECARYDLELPEFPALQELKSNFVHSSVALEQKKKFHFVSKLGLNDQNGRCRLAEQVNQSKVTSLTLYADVSYKASTYFAAYTNLTHLTLTISDSLDRVLTEMRGCRFPAVTHLKIDNQQAIWSLFRRNQENELPIPSPDTVAIFPRLSSLHLMLLPIRSFDWAVKAFASVERMRFDVFQQCLGCGNCSEFFDSLAAFKKLKSVQVVRQITQLSQAEAETKTNWWSSLVGPYLRDSMRDQAVQADFELENNNSSSQE